MASSKQKRMLETGEIAPEFRLPDVNGVTHRSRDLLAEGPVVLAFFKVSCPTCQFTFPFLQRMHQGGSLRMFAVSQNDAAATRDFNASFDITMPALLDSEESGYIASNAFGISHVPSLFLIEPDGLISWSSEGFVSKDLAALAERAGVTAFKPGEYVPEMRAG